MNINRSELKGNAKSALRGKGGVMALTMLAYIGVTILCGVVSLIPVVGFIISFIITSVLVLGLIKMSLKVARLGSSVQVSDLFSGFSNIWKAVGLIIVVEIFTFLWSLLFVIPGIIAACRYSMAMYILADNPEIGIMEAIAQSKEMTKGYKWSFFVLQLSFIGWAILSVFTLYILCLWLVPYMFVTLAYFYLKIKGEGNIVEPVIQPVSQPVSQPIVESVVEQ